MLILRKEIQIHCVSDITHEADQQKLQRCLRDQLKSSAEAAIILEQARALQGIPKTERELKAERGKVQLIYSVHFSEMRKFPFGGMQILSFGILSA